MISHRRCAPLAEAPYRPGLLDDPAMAHGKHRHVMIGDPSIGPVVSSVLHFVEVEGTRMAWRV